MARRCLDIVGALLALLVSLPLLVAVAIAIKLDSRGPLFYTQLRVGHRGRLFRLYKFRSMFVRSETGSAITTSADPRVTRLGHLLRPLRIDELPQLINVLTGDMSLVGPRPEAPPVVEQYTPEQRQVLAVRPGITGPTQLAWLNEADRFPPGVDHEQYYITRILPEKLSNDLRYIRTRTFRGDLAYLLLTPVRLATFAFVRRRAGGVLETTPTR